MFMTSLGARQSAYTLGTASLLKMAFAFRQDKNLQYGQELCIHCSTSPGATQESQLAGKNLVCMETSFKRTSSSLSLHEYVFLPRKGSFHQGWILL